MIKVIFYFRIHKFFIFLFELKTMAVHVAVVYILCFISSYFIGSIPFSWIVTKFKTGEDLRKIGSGNVGGRNVFRATKSKFWAIFAGLLDLSRSIAAILLPYFLSNQWYFSKQSYILLYPNINILYDFILTVVGLGAILGHNWPIYLLSHGGRGITVVIASSLSINSILLGFWIVLWPIIIIIVGYSSITYIVVTLLVGVIALFLPSSMMMPWAKNNYSIAIIFFIIAVIMISRQRDNFRKIKTGEAKKIELIKALRGKSKMGEEMLK